MIITRDLTPRIVSYKSRDFQLLSTLLDLVVNSVNLDITYFTNLIDPKRVSSNWLEVIGSLVGYEYNHDLTTEQNRFIILNYKSVLRLRGSQEGVSYVVAMYLKLIGRDDTQFRVTVPSNTASGMVPGYIYIDDQFLDMSTIPILVNMLEWVRPIGARYVVRKASTTDYKNYIYGINSVATYQFEYPIDVSTLTGKGTKDDRSFVTSGPEIARDPAEFDIDHPDNVVGHTIVQPKKENE